MGRHTVRPVLVQRGRVLLSFHFTVVFCTLFFLLQIQKVVHFMLFPLKYADLLSSLLEIYVKEVSQRKKHDI